MAENETNSRNYQHCRSITTYCEKDTNKLGQVTNISRSTEFSFFFKYIFWRNLNPQTTTFGWNRSELKKLPTLSIRYQHIMKNVLTILPMMPTFPTIQDLLSSLDLYFWRNFKILKPINNSVWMKMKPTQKVTNFASQLPTYYDKGTNMLG